MRTKLKMIAISKENYLELKKYGQAGDSFNDALTNVLNIYFHLIDKKLEQTKNTHPLYADYLDNPE